jgi:8-oxo-dGTP pyrophosphatase MutT (NUDIX family)
MTELVIGPMRERLAARVLLFDPVGRLLLLKGRLPSAPDAPGWWFTVGGGIEPGESVREAALREIAEETGFATVTLGDVLFETDQVLHDRKQRPVRHRSTFLFARCEGGEPSREGWQALEREFVDDIRWWTPGDLAALTEPVYPADLAARAYAAWRDHG